MRLRSRADCQLNVKASLVAVFVAVFDVRSICLALDADLLIQGDVGKLHGDQGLQVLGVQQLAVVRVVLERETFAHAKVIDLSDLALVLRFLQKRSSNYNVTRSEADSETQTLCLCPGHAPMAASQTYLGFAVNGDDVGVHFALQISWQRADSGSLQRRKELSGEQELAPNGATDPVCGGGRVAV